MAHTAGYSASVGFDISSKDWSWAYTTLEGTFSRGQVTQIDLVPLQDDEDGRPIFARMAVDASGAAVNVGVLNLSLIHI